LAVGLVLSAGKHDETKTRSPTCFRVMVAFVGAFMGQPLYQVPQDETTAAIVGRLVSSAGAVVAYGLGGRRNQ
jgi:hypothetical protein